MVFHVPPARISSAKAAQGWNPLKPEIFFAISFATAEDSTLASVLG